MLKHAKVVWVIRTSPMRNQRHWTHLLWWNMQRLFKWSKHFFWEIRGTGLTPYIGTCKGCLSDQDIPPGKSEALDSLTMLEHAKVVWVIRTFLLRNQRHWTHSLCWNNTEVDWVIRTSLLRNQRHWTHSLCWNNAEVDWVIRTSLLRNQRHWTHSLYWNICFSEIDQEFNSFLHNKMHLPIGYF